MQVATLCHPFVVPLVESWVDRGHTINMVSGYCKSGDLGAMVHNPRVTSALTVLPTMLPMQAARSI